MLGRPDLALLSVEGPRIGDLRGMVGLLAERMRHAPNDRRGFILLGRAYLSLGDPGDASKAFARAIVLSQGHEGAALLSAYGESLTQAASGVVTPQAEMPSAVRLSSIRVIRRAVLFRPGLCRARTERLRDGVVGKSAGRRAPTHHGAANLWTGSPRLKAASGGAPDISAMVAGLAARSENFSQRSSRLAAIDPRLFRSGRCTKGTKPTRRRAQSHRATRALGA